MGSALEFGYISDIGQLRENNEDAALVFFSAALNDNRRPLFGVFVVADGMGGHLNGEKAAAIVTETLVSDAIQHIYHPIFATADENFQLPVGDIVTEAISKANQVIRQNYVNAGATVTALAVLGNMAHIVHVGDSRAYMIREGEIEQITEDHTVAERLVGGGFLTREEADQSPEGHRIYRAVGIFDDVEADTYMRRFRPGSAILVCSDGLYNLVPGEEIRQVVEAIPNPQAACDQLVKMANDRGAPDNVTVILVKMNESS